MISAIITIKKMQGAYIAAPLSYFKSSFTVLFLYSVCAII